jgi:hypothetical protein
MLPIQAAIGGAMAAMMKDTPMYKSYVAVAPNPAEFPRLLDRMSELMRQPYNWADDVKRLHEPVMLVWGDNDMFRPEHMIEFYSLLGGVQRDAGWQREHMSNNHWQLSRTSRTTTSSPRRGWFRQCSRSSTARRPRRAGLRKSRSPEARLPRRARLQSPSRGHDGTS